MNRTIISQCLFGVAVLISTAAHADDRGAYAGVRIGNEMEDRFGGEADFVETDRAWGLYGGWNFNSHWGIETGYSDLGETIDTRIIVDAGFRVDGHLLNVGATYRYPFSDSFDVFAALGVFDLSEDGTAITIAGPRALDRDDTGPYLEVGARYHFSDLIAVRGSYQYFDFGDVFNSSRDGTPWIGAEFSF